MILLFFVAFQKETLTVVELGFVRRLRTENNKIEVRRLLKAFVDAQWLDDFDVRLKTYQSSELTGATSGKED